MRGTEKPGELTPYGMINEVKKKYTGARESFILARLSLKAGVDLREVREGDNDPTLAAKLRAAIREICKDVQI